MDSPELPECPVCLQTYDGVCTIPRVLACGHTACEYCLINIPQKYPQTICCPACTQLVKYPSPQGPSSLPKNIDLLRLIPGTAIAHHLQTKFPGKGSRDDVNVDRVEFLPPLWSDEFYITWKRWIMPQDAVFMEEKGKGDGLLREGNKKIKLFKVGRDVFDCNGKGSVFKFSYAARILKLLSEMEDEVRGELGLVLKICSRQRRVNKVYGLWGDLEDGSLYLVFRKLNWTAEEMLGNFGDVLSEDGLPCFAMIGMEICEAVLALHLDGLTLGCFGFSCFELDGFGRLSLNLSEILVTGGMIHRIANRSVCGGRKIGEKDIGLTMGKIVECAVFVSPEVLFDISKEQTEMEHGNFSYSVGHNSDVWSLACVLLRLLLGGQFTEELVDSLRHVILKGNEESYSDCYSFNEILMEKVSSMFLSKCSEEFKCLQQTLCRCLNFDPGSRPVVSDILKCVRKLIFKSQFDSMLGFNEAIYEQPRGRCLVNGKLCKVPEGKPDEPGMDKFQGPVKFDEENPAQIEGIKDNKIFTNSLLKGNIKVKGIQGHLGCITGLTIGGGFLFSSSFDKSIRVWSLQDFSHVHTFKGHEHKVMAVTYADEEQPLCISGDSGGGIFLWNLNNPLGQEPLKKWCEQKDWRYSGIHALTTDGNGHLYTGSGDRLIKAWSIPDGTLICRMEGHKSVVSSLIAYGGVLYSGSWDGTIHLWSLIDHSILTVLGEDIPRSVTSVLSLTVNQNILVASHEDGHVKVWRNDMLMKSLKFHSGAVFATTMDNTLLFTGGWDRNVSVQELSRDEFDVDMRPLGSIPGDSAVTALLYWQGQLFVGYGDTTIKVNCLPKQKTRSGVDSCQPIPLKHVPCSSPPVA
ncbi:hypothetical protein K2173_028548 [Erythroxylum novogranatense]|uniref:Uncharacterized protein n=1 Tax=Erythroxylum novogranatense TaxID=1862640 RepID=A0AAV8U3H3_9ROSI|nr:hypothetical protein K2173_028548 [Erythroxylum novogranatense]